MQGRPFRFAESLLLLLSRFHLSWEKWTVLVIPLIRRQLDKVLMPCMWLCIAISFQIALYFHRLVINTEQKPVPPPRLGPFQNHPLLERILCKTNRERTLPLRVIAMEFSRSPRRPTEIRSTRSVGRNEFLSPHLASLLKGYPTTKETQLLHLVRVSNSKMPAANADKDGDGKCRGRMITNHSF